MKSKTDRLIEVLSNGEQYTVRQIMKKTGLKNPYSAVSRLRVAGVRIYTNKRLHNGRVKHYYRAPANQFWIQI